MTTTTGSIFTVTINVQASEDITALVAAVTQLVGAVPGLLQVEATPTECRTSSLPVETASPVDEEPATGLASEPVEATPVAAKRTTYEKYKAIAEMSGRTVLEVKTMDARDRRALGARFGIEFSQIRKGRPKTPETEKTARAHQKQRMEYRIEPGVGAFHRRTNEQVDFSRHKVSGDDDAVLVYSVG